MTKETAKKTLGRRKIDIKRIENKSSLQVTFSKRRSGLFKKAGELCVFSGAQIGILVQSPSEKVFAFGSPEFGSIFDRFESGVSSLLSSSDDRCRMDYEEAQRQLEVEKRRMKELDGNKGNCWWNDTFEGMDLFEMQGYVNALEGLVGRVLDRADVVGRLHGCDVVEAPDSSLLVQEADHVQGMEGDQKLDGGVRLLNCSMENGGYCSNHVQGNEELLNCSRYNAGCGSNLVQQNEELLNCSRYNAGYGSNLVQGNEELLNCSIENAGYGSNLVQGNEELLNCSTENSGHGSSLVQEIELINIDEWLNPIMENVDCGSNIGQENELIDIEELLNCLMENVGSNFVQENELICPTGISTR